jgi:hypothetical protein
MFISGIPAHAQSFFSWHLFLKILSITACRSDIAYSTLMTRRFFGFQLSTTETAWHCW